MLETILRPLHTLHGRLPSRFLKKVPFEAFAIVVGLLVVNIVAWAVCLGVLVCSIFVHLGRPGMDAKKLSISGVSRQAKHTWVEIIAQSF